MRFAYNRSMKGIRRKVGRYVPKPVLRVIRRHTVVPARRIWGPRVPIAMITGTKGKTTTTRMLAYILSEAGHRVGFSSTDGVVINGECRSRYDAAGYVGAREVLTDRTITAAVLETARGGLLRHGFYIDRCDVAALLNVGREQIGIDGIDTVEQMAALKQRVIDAARGTVVLNADDAQCCKLIRQYPSNRTILFSLQADNRFVQNHIQNGGSAYFLNSTREGGDIERLDKASKVSVISIADLPSSGNGLFPQNIANAMAAAALADGMAIPMEIIRVALQSFENSLEHSPGRLNLLDGYAQTVLLDSAVHVPSATALVDSLGRINVSGRRLCMFDTPGNRPDWHYAELGELLGPHFDLFVCYELEKYRRGRAPGEISELLKTGLVHARVSPDRIDTAQGFVDATRRLSQLVEKDDLVVILMTSARDCLPIFHEHFSMHQISDNL